MQRFCQNLSVFVAGISLLVAASPSTAAPSRRQSEFAGATLFRDKGCAYCHGADAAGTAKGPSLAKVRKRLTAPQLTDQIENGGQKMPAFGDSVSHDEISQLVAFLRAKHRPPIPPATQTTAPASPLSNPVQ